MVLHRVLRRTPKLLIAAALGVAGLPFLAVPAHAIDIPVTSTADSGPGTLRAAIQQANATLGPDQISIPPGTYTVTSVIPVTDSVQIVGTGGAAVTIIDGNLTDRLFTDSSGATLTIEGVTVQEFKSPSTYSGGAIDVDPGTLVVLDSVFTHNESHAGGAIALSSSSLTIQRSSFVENSAVSAPNSSNDGASLFISSTNFVIDQSLFASNHAVKGPGGAAVIVQSSGTITNSTFTQNTAGYYGGAIRSDQSSTTIRHSTIADNTAGLGGGGIFSIGSGNVTLLNTLLSGNKNGVLAENCEVNANGTFSSSGGNLSDDPTCTALTQPSDLDDDPDTTLATLADNGGPTRTRALVAGSSAIDAAPCSAAVTVDQRNSSRPSGSNCDVGAFEVQQVPPTSSTTTTAEPTTTSTSSSTTSAIVPSTTSTTTPSSVLAGSSGTTGRISGVVLATPRFTG